MGIRFSCPNGHKLHVKNFLAGKRGVCPECGVTVDIPAVGIHRQPPGPAAATQSVNPTTVAASTFTTPPEDGAEWFVRSPSGEQFGPAAESVFREWIEQGRVTENCLVLKEGWRDWRAASTISPTLGFVPGPKTSLPKSPQLDSESPILEPSQVISPPSADPTANEIRIETQVPQKTPKHKKRWLVYLLIAACLLLSLPLVYVFSNN